MFQLSPLRLASVDGAESRHSLEMCVRDGIVDVRTNIKGECSSQLVSKGAEECGHFFFDDSRPLASGDAELVETPLVASSKV